MTPTSMPERADEFRKAYRRVRDEIGKVIVGHADIVHGVLTCLFVGGHASAGRRARPGQDAAGAHAQRRCST